MFDLIIFDCDGTLTDTESVNNQALLDILHEEGLHQYTLEHVVEEWMGRANASILTAVQMETGRILPADMNTRILLRSVALQKDALKAVEGAPELVVATKAKCKICVASNGGRLAVVSALEKSGLMVHFTAESVFTASDVKNPKPYPDLFLYAAAKMGVDPERCLVIEDSAAGTRAGVAAGMTTFGFSGSSHNPEKQEEILKAAGATAVFSRLIHIRMHLGL